MATEIYISDEAKLQSIEAGFVNVEDYLYNLLQKDRDRLACLKGIQDIETGRSRPFTEFDSQFRKKHGIKIEE